MYLKSYQVTLKTKSPVFIGSGREINKKEYLFASPRKVSIIDPYKLYLLMKQKGMSGAYEGFLLGKGTDGSADLDNWLRKHNISYNQIAHTVKYQVNCGDTIRSEGKRIQVMECMKDPYNQPYIPGSSLKGMLRTIILFYMMANDPKKFADVRDGIERETSRELRQGERPPSRNSFLSKNIKDGEISAFHTLKRVDPYSNKEIDSRNAVCDVFQGFIVSDSEPLTTDDLVFCQKIDRNEKGEEHSLPILRECIADGCEIHFTITIDTSVCHFDEAYLMKAIEFFSAKYYERFSSKFDKEVPEKNQVWLGGGTGFATKTVLNALFDEKKSVYITSKIFEKTETEVTKNHNHASDVKRGVSPHILKCTYNAGQMQQMGMCEFSMKQIL